MNTGDTPPSRQSLWNERHERAETADKGPEPVLIEAASRSASGRALDLGCGLGRNSLFLAQAGWEVTAVDYSEVALNRLREHSSDPQLRLHAVHADIEGGEFQIEPDRFDLICDCCFLDRTLFPHIRQGLRSGGRFVGVLPVVDPFAGKPINPAYLVEPGELLSYFNDWHVEHWEESRPGNQPERRLRAYLIARKP